MKEKIASVMIGMLLFATAYSVAGTMNFDKDKTSIEKLNTQ
jgi:hypothetical protein